MQQQSPAISPFEMEIMQMGFQLDDIRQAIKQKTESKQKIIEYLISKQNKQKQSKKQMNDEKDQENGEYESFVEDYKMIFLARMDIKITLGKIAVQVANSALAAFKQVESRIEFDQQAEIAYYQWTESGQKKIVVKVNSQEELLSLVEKLRKEKINVFVARSTKQDELNIPEGTVTVAAVGPAPEELLDKLTGHLKLF